MYFILKQFVKITIISSKRCFPNLHMSTKSNFKKKRQLLPCEIVPITDLFGNTEKLWDTLCVIGREPPELSDCFNHYRSIDQFFDNEVSCFPFEDYRIVYSPINKINDYDDTRIYERAAEKAIARAVKAGSRVPVVVLPNNGINGKFQYKFLSTLLGALYQLYVPIQLREDVPRKAQQITTLGVYLQNEEKLLSILDMARNIEEGRFIARDIGGGDPERMTAPCVTDYVQQIFGESRTIEMNVISDPVLFTREYPLFQAVNRAAGTVERHAGRIIFLEYRSPKSANKTLLLVGKGVTYDTGGADRKSGGIMATMSRDKCGAAAVAGFMQIVRNLKPRKLNVIAAMCMVRNSVGEECYVSDEVITSRAGLRVRVSNTDCEGRMCMADVICKMKERAISLPDPHIYSIATLTYHARRCVGNGYTIVMDNGPARFMQHDHMLKTIGDEIGNPFEVSTLRSEDFRNYSGVCLGEDVVQTNTKLQNRNDRNHQGATAFMIMASGLHRHGLNTKNPIKYSNLDIMGSAGNFPFAPTGAPILALAKMYLYN